MLWMLGAKARDFDAPTSTTVVIEGFSGEHVQPNLVQELVAESQTTLINWAASAGLVSGGTRSSNEQGSANDDSNQFNDGPTVLADRVAPISITGESASGRSTKNGASPLAFVSEAMGLEPSLGSGLLDALVLGGGALYAFNRFSGGKVSGWVRRLLPATPRGYYAGVAGYERVVTVFLMEAETGLQRLVAAKVTDERLEILAEQVLPMSLSAAASPAQADLDRELKQLVKKVTDQTNSRHDLLLFDPKLKEDLPSYETLGKTANELEPKTLQAVLRQLKDNQLTVLRQWINKPSSTDINTHPIANQLKRRQKQLHKLVNNDKARLVSILELSLAMAQRLA